MLLIIALFMVKSREPFVDAYGAPLDNKLENDSLPLELEMKVKYPKAFYYELDNKAFERGLQECFNVAQKPDALAILNQTGWDPIENSMVTDIYATILATVKGLLIQKASYFALPDGSAPPLQVTHNRLIKAAIHLDDSADADTVPSYLVKAEFTFYREGKFQGKHIGALCYIPPNNGLRFLQMNIIGVVNPDTIGLWPVRPLDNFFNIHENV
jgi:hypothetical protein